MNDSNPKVSIIIAVYKAESYLKKCVDSLLVQTFYDFEILLIDDGSPDCSGEICDKYAEVDCRVRVFHKPNEGVSATRQFGIDHARGEYTIYVDPDDWVEPAMLDELYRKAKEEDADMVICDFYNEVGQKIVLCKQQPTAMDHETVLKELFQRLHGSLWNKLIKLTCYKRYAIRFPEGISFCEDLLVCTRLLKNPLKIAYLNKAFYHYVRGINKNSLIRSYNRETLTLDWKLYSLFMDEFKGADPPPAMDNTLICTVLMRAFNGGGFSSKEFRVQFAKYKGHLLRRENKDVTFYLCWLSCFGFYRIIRILLKIRRSMKELLGLYLK